MLLLLLLPVFDLIDQSTYHLKLIFLPLTLYALPM